jgi:cytochrome bd ubiquinol oxidase subunit II
MTGVALILGYGLLGATWCVMKTTGELELWARQMAMRFLIGVMLAIAIVSLWVPFLGLEIERRWFSWPNIVYLAPVPLVTVLVGWQLQRALQQNRMYQPFFLAIALFLLGYFGLAISLFPHVVPPNVTIWQAANTVHSQQFALVGFLLVFPITLAYNAYAYWVFRGKVAENVQASSYH